MSALLAAGLSGCVTPAQSPTAAGTTAPASATPTPTPTQVINWTPIVDAARLTKKEYAHTESKDEKFASAFVLPCNAAPTGTQRAASAWNFVNAKGEFVIQAVAAYEPAVGTAVVDEVRAGLSGCRDWKSSGGDLRMENAGEFTVSRPAGTDNSMAYCYRMTFLSGPVKDDTIVVCEVFFSRGHLVGMIGTFDKNARVSRDRITKLAPVGAAALVRALPAP